MLRPRPPLLATVALGVLVAAASFVGGAWPMGPPPHVARGHRPTVAAPAAPTRDAADLHGASTPRSSGPAAFAALLGAITAVWLLRMVRGAAPAGGDGRSRRVDRWRRRLLRGPPAPRLA